jgi:hypothetical protein
VCEAIGGARVVFRRREKERALLVPVGVVHEAGDEGWFVEGCAVLPPFEAGSREEDGLVWWWEMGRGLREIRRYVRLVAQHPQPLAVDPVAWREVLVSHVGGVEVLEAADVMRSVPLGVAGGFADWGRVSD